jgi:hypothetical protein
MKGKMALLVGASVLLTVGAGFRAGVNLAVSDDVTPRWYHSKEAFYCFNFGIEALVVCAYAACRFDRRFYVPEGSSAPGDYSGESQGLTQGADAAGEGEQEEGHELDERDARGATYRNRAIMGDATDKNRVGERSAV